MNCFMCKDTGIVANSFAGNQSCNCCKIATNRATMESIKDRLTASLQEDNAKLIARNLELEKALVRIYDLDQSTTHTDKADKALDEVGKIAANALGDIPAARKALNAGES